MAKKFTLEIVQERLKAINPNIEILSDTYTNSFTKHLFKCKVCENEWLATFDKLLHQKTGCPKCAKANKLPPSSKPTLSEIKERLSHLSITIISTEYKNFYSKMQCKCNDCDNEFEASYANLRKARIACPRCSKIDRIEAQKLSLDEVTKTLKSKKTTLLSDTYKNYSDLLKCKCDICEYEFEASFRECRRANLKCPRCRGLTLTLKDVQKMVSKEVEILSFENKHTPLLCECKICKHKWEASYSNLVRHQTKCPECFKKKKFSLDEVKKQVVEINSNIEIIATDYKNTQSPLLCKCKICEHEWNACHNNLVFNQTGCPKCARKQTKGEKKVQELLESLGIEFVMNDRSVLSNNKELDFYIPSLKVAIEINGEFWHSSAQERIYKNYHLDKTRECEALGIHLYQFWSLNDLVKKEQIVKSMIKNALKLASTTRVFARKCEVRKITSKEGRAFCEQNHIQGGGIASVYFGLFYEGRLVSVMSFGKSRFNKKVEWELIRFCSLLNYSVVGAGSRLLKHFEIECKPKSLISYANRRWASANSNLYQAIGFKFIREAEPNYTYYKDNKYDGRMFNRITFQRHKIEKWFGKTFDKNMTETEILKSEGFVQIYDCGNLVYLKEYE